MEILKGEKERELPDSKIAAWQFPLLRRLFIQTNFIAMKKKENIIDIPAISLPQKN